VRINGGSKLLTWKNKTKKNPSLIRKNREENDQEESISDKREHGKIRQIRIYL